MPNGKEMNTQFNYFKNGELVNVKYRTGDKKFFLISNAELIFIWIARKDDYVIIECMLSYIIG